MRALSKRAGQRSYLFIVCTPEWGSQRRGHEIQPNEGKVLINELRYLKNFIQYKLLASNLPTYVKEVS